MKKYEHGSKLEKIKTLHRYMIDYSALNGGRPPNWHQLREFDGRSETTFKATLAEMRGRGLIDFRHWGSIIQRNYNVNRFLD